MKYLCLLLKNSSNLQQNKVLLEHQSIGTGDERLENHRKNTFTRDF